MKKKNSYGVGRIYTAVIRKIKNDRIFFDIKQPLPLFFGEYLAMMGLWVCIAYYGSRLLQKYSGKKNTHVE